jgi:hypothetical protein
MEKPTPPNLADSAKKYLQRGRKSPKKMGGQKKESFQSVNRTMPSPPANADLGNTYSLDFGTKMGAQRPRYTDK